MNYFDFYKLPITLNLDIKYLRQLFLKKSKEYHPDYHTLEPITKQQEILELSTLNNEAYKTLKDTEKRIKYVLELKNLLGAAIKPSIPQDFLLEMMDINEKIMELQFDYNVNTANIIRSKIENKEIELRDSVQHIIDNYNDETSSINELELIRDHYLKNRYLLRLKENMSKLI
ncbi:MAG: Fe-S protein assembly co-chaperone HscB [Saprospiraceae bacterium]|nr:Fe-S protein assembly co-chaperone HscB [Saprospiraceae bacterium]